MSTATIRFTGNLNTQPTHTKSGQQFLTDAPIDNNGKGESFSPTDLAAVSLGSCMLTLMAITAREKNIELKDALVTIAKHMVSNPRRIAKIEVAIQVLDEGLSLREKRILEKAALNCPVAKSLHPDIEQDVSFDFTSKIDEEANR